MSAALDTTPITLRLRVPRLFSRYDLEQPVREVVWGRDVTVEDPLRLAVFISGSGSGMEALIRHQSSNDCLHETTLVVSNLPGVAGLNKAESHHVKTVVVELDKSITDLTERRKSPVSYTHLTLPTKA